jgi:hypothetical protein
MGSEDVTELTRTEETKSKQKEVGKLKTMNIWPFSEVGWAATEKKSVTPGIAQTNQTFSITQNLGTTEVYQGIMMLRVVEFNIRLGIDYK